MPCNTGGYSENTDWQEFCERTARCFRYLAEKRNVQIPEWIRSASNGAYISDNRLDKLTAMLCELCNTTSEDVIYNGRDAKMRKVADWWDEHKKSDEIRKKEEKIKEEKKKLKKQALEKLTKEERKALGF